MPLQWRPGPLYRKVLVLALAAFWTVGGIGQVNRLREDRRVRESGREVTAEVLKAVYTSRRAPLSAVVRYDTPDGFAVSRIDIRGSSETVSVGYAIKIRYDESEPENAVLASLNGPRFWTSEFLLWLLLLGLVFIPLGVLVRFRK